MGDNNERSKLWDTTIRVNFEKLIKCTKINPEMVSFLFQTEIIPSTSIQSLLFDPSKSPELKATDVYLGLVGKYDPTLLTNFVDALDKGTNNLAARIIRNGMLLTNTDNNTTSSSTMEPSSKLESSLQACYPQKTAQQRSKPGPTKFQSDLNPFCPYPEGKKLALIINVTYKRPGTNSDVEDLHEVLTHCGFDHVEICEEKNCTKSGIKTKIQEFKAKLTEIGAGNLGGCLVALMSHGKSRDRFLDQNGKSVDLKAHVIAPFNAEECPVLEHIPKVFLINICRGEKEDILIRRTTAENDSSESELDESVSDNDWDEYFGTLRCKSVSIRKENAAAGSESDTVELTPLWMHMLIGLSSIEDYVSYRTEELDSRTGQVLKANAVYIQEFCNAIRTFAKDQPVDIYKIFQRVSHAVSKQSTVYHFKDGRTGHAKQLPLLMNKGFCMEFPLHYK